MFAPRQQGTVIAKGLKIVGSVTAEGLVEVNGQIEGELHCTSLVIARGAHIRRILTESLQPNASLLMGKLRVRENTGGEVILKSQAHVVGDIHHQSLAIERGAYFDGRSIPDPEELMGTSQRELVTSASSRSRTIARRLAPRLGGLTR